jgi:hypothetical protein
MGVALAPVVPRVDERYRPFHQFHDRDVPWSAHLQGSELRHPIDIFAGLMVATTCSSVKPRPMNFDITQGRYGIPGVLPENT